VFLKRAPDGAVHVDFTPPRAVFRIRDPEPDLQVQAVGAKRTR
jgi:hypothetical protein